MVETLGRQQLLAQGYRPLILQLYAVEGMNVAGIRQYLREHHAVEVSPHTLGRFVAAFGPKEELMKVAAQREAADLHKMALRRLEMFQDDYDRARQIGDVKLMDHCEKGFQTWWDRVGKWHFATPGSNPMMLLQQTNNIQINNPVQIALDAARDHPEVLEKMLQKLKGQEVIDV